MDKLYICIPAYNEEANIRQVIREWHSVVVKIGVQSRLVVVDDGSKDDTFKIMTELTQELPQLIALTKRNSGHGATVLYAYRYALAADADYVFQTDSDGQTMPIEFWPFWEERKKYAALIGNRIKRQDGASRVFVTKVLKLVLNCVFGVAIPDANTPFRLIEGTTLKGCLEKIPPDFNLANVMLTVCLVKRLEKVKFIPITFRPRQGGVNSINFRRIFAIGKQAVKDFYRIKKEFK
jgi:glycosyltransferase involved in cell wall biosynthesis